MELARKYITFLSFDVSLDFSVRRNGRDCWLRPLEAVHLRSTRSALSADHNGGFKRRLRSHWQLLLDRQVHMMFKQPHEILVLETFPSIDLRFIEQPVP